LSSFLVLDAAIGEDRKDWLELWSSWTDREVSAHPDYVRLFATPGDRAVCAAFRGVRGSILLPLVLRSLDREPWIGDLRGLFDATTPYGYSGPFGWGVTDTEVDTFWSQLRAWLLRERAVTLFARLSLFPEQLVRFDGEVADTAVNVVRRLDLDEETLWLEYEHKVRKNVNRARRSGLVVELDETGHRLDEFIAIYEATMRRREALSGYYFDNRFFASIMNDLRGQYVFFHVLTNGRVISTELVLVSEHYLYSFLGGTLEEAFPQRPNDLLKHEIICWGIATGKRALVLGGGYTAEDGIFRYKLSFAPTGRVMFRTGRIVIDRNAYEQLVATRSCWEQGQGRVWQVRDRYFPAYRA